MAQKIIDALKVIVLTRHIREYLELYDPKALAQAERALVDHDMTYAAKLREARTIADSQPLRACENCGHAELDHTDGECYNGAGDGNRCDCREYAPDPNDTIAAGEACAELTERNAQPGRRNKMDTGDDHYPTF
jgi:hypothetical protein